MPSQHLVLKVFKTSSFRTQTGMLPLMFRLLIILLVEAIVVSVESLDLIVVQFVFRNDEFILFIHPVNPFTSGLVYLDKNLFLILH